MNRELICIVCPKSCHVAIKHKGNKIKEMKGVQCQKGREFVENEIINPLRIFTGSVQCENGNFLLVSVKTTKPIPKKFMKEIAKITHQIIIKAPVDVGQIIVPDILGQDADLVSTRQVKPKIATQ